MKFGLIFALLALILISCQSDSNLKDKVAELSSKVDSLEKISENGYTPGLGILMSAIQLHHLKIWKSAMVSNWQLAGYELHEMEERFEEIEQYHTGSNEVKHLKMIFPQIENLEKPIDNEDIVGFKKGYETLTATCNGCHQLNDKHFLKIIVPNEKNENQLFTP